MSSGIRLRLEAYGNEAWDVPVKVEIFDKSLRLVKQEWLRAKGSVEYLLEPGVYGVRTSVSSGAVFEEAVEVHAGQIGEFTVPLHTLSPHEDHEWAYLTQLTSAQGAESFCSARYEGVWARLWQRRMDGTWCVLPLPVHDGSKVSWEEDGVSYNLQVPEDGFYAVHVGGPRIPWKLIALPSSYGVRMLVRPTSAPHGRAHPLDVVVVSDDLRVETLLAFMQRGDISQAQDLDGELAFAEQLLYGKVRDVAGAAVGGYFLLRAHDLARLHDWVNNLANWFEWMPDGAVIHAWQLIAEVRRDSSGKEDRFRQARGRLLEAVRRGFPLYTEGLRLLRDGLLLLDQMAQGEDEKVRRALCSVGEYTAVADWSATMTTFTGEHPDRPSAKSRRGRPRGRDPLIYVYDVPLREALSRGALKEGEELIADLADGLGRCTLHWGGTLVLPDGRSFKSLGAMHTALTGTESGAWRSWRLASTGESLATVVEGLRTQP